MSINDKVDWREVRWHLNNRVAPVVVEVIKDFVSERPAWEWWLLRVGDRLRQKPEDISLEVCFRLKTRSPIVSKKQLRSVTIMVATLLLRLENVRISSQHSLRRPPSELKFRITLDDFKQFRKRERIDV